MYVLYTLNKCVLQDGDSCTDGGYIEMAKKQGTDSVQKLSQLQ